MKPQSAPQLFAVALAASAGSALAQPELQIGSQVPVAYVGESVQDFLIPNKPGAEVTFSVQGADGGGAVEARVTPFLAPFFIRDSVKGGEGVTVVYRARIGYGTGELRPGGVIRYIIGQQGQRSTDALFEPNRLFPGANGGGGGGGSGLLYDAENDNANWTILAVAGAGGGAFGNPKSVGVDASTNETGSDGLGDQFAGQNAGGILGRRAQDPTSGGAGHEPGFPAPGAGGGQTTGGRGGRNTAVDAFGGWGYGGGGAGVNSGSTLQNTTERAGGGGGFSGGGAGIKGGGGGGGSYWNPNWGNGTITVGNDAGNGAGTYFVQAFDPPQGAVNLGVVDVAGTLGITTALSDFDTTLTVYDGNGRVVGQGQETDSSIQERINANLTPGDYFVSFQGAPNRGSDGFQVANGSSAAGTLRFEVGLGFRGERQIASGETAFYRFTVVGEPENTVGLGAIGTPGDYAFAGEGTGAHLTLALYDSLLGSLRPGLTYPPSFFESPRLNTNLGPGRYLLGVADGTFMFRNFYQTSQVLNPSPSQSFTTTFGSTSVSDSLGPNEISWYSFEINDFPTATNLGVVGPAGRFTMFTAATGQDAVPFVFDASGKVVAEGLQTLATTPGSPSGRYLEAFMDPGVYYLAVTAGGNELQDYFELNQRNEDRTPFSFFAQLNVGPNSSFQSTNINEFSVFSDGTDVRYYRFELSAARPCSNVDTALPIGAYTSLDLTDLMIRITSGQLTSDTDLDATGTVDVFDLMSALRTYDGGC